MTDREHFDYLLKTYFPDHRGVFWREGCHFPKYRSGCRRGNDYRKTPELPLPASNIYFDYINSRKRKLRVFFIVDSTYFTPISTSIVN